MPLDEEDSDDEEYETAEEEGPSEPAATEEIVTTEKSDLPEVESGQLFVKGLDGKTMIVESLTSSVCSTTKLECSRRASGSTSLASN